MLTCLGIPTLGTPPPLGLERDGEVHENMGKTQGRWGLHLAITVHNAQQGKKTAERGSSTCPLIQKTPAAQLCPAPGPQGRADCTKTVGGPPHISVLQAAVFCLAPGSPLLMASCHSSGSSLPLFLLGAFPCCKFCSDHSGRTLSAGHPVNLLCVPRTPVCFLSSLSTLGRVL